MNLFWDEIEQISLYNQEYHTKQLSDIEILKLLLESDKQCFTKRISESLTQSTNSDGTVTNNGTEQAKSAQPGPDSDPDPKNQSEQADQIDISMSDLSNTMQSLIESALRGTTAGSLFEDVFKSIKVNTGWFKKIKATFKKQVYYMTHNYTTSWVNINNTYRHIYMAPKKQFFDDKIEIILSIDQSGSMSTDDLQRLLYLIESEAKKITKLTVLIHSTVIIKQFELADEYDISKSQEFTEALATRWNSGGTSHDCVFQAIGDLNIKDPSKTIFLCYSDMQSNIEETVRSYPIMSRLKSFWVHTAGAHTLKPSIVPGTFIHVT